MKSSYREALRAGIRDAMIRDERVFLMGEDVGAYGGSFAVSLGLLEEFGPDRIRDTPLSESGFVGAGIGAALGGMRPIVEIMTVNFSLLALDQIVNNAATLLHMSGGQFHVPLVIRMTTGAGRQLGAQHSHSLEGWYAHIPGLRILAPATLEDARGMLWTALQDPDPVLIFEHGSLYNVPGELADDAGPVDISTAAIRRPGNDISLITYGGTLPAVLDAAEQLAADGIDAEVLDLRTLRPLDDAAILASVARTHRAVVVDEGWRSGSLSAEVSARITEQAFFDLDAPGGPGLQRRGADPLCQAPGTGRPAVRGTDRGRGQSDGRAPVGDFLMPSLGADMEHGKIVEWLVKPGDYVRRGDLVAVVDTDKTVMDVESFQEGVVADLLVGIGETVPVGTPLARITQTPAEVGAPVREAPPPRAPSKAARSRRRFRRRPPRRRVPRSRRRCGIWRTGWAWTPAGSRAPARTAPSPARTWNTRWRPGPAVPGRVRSSPLARRLAAELGIELSTVTGTGPDGAVTVADVQGAAAAAQGGARGRGRTPVPEPQPAAAGRTGSRRKRRQRESRRRRPASAWPACAGPSAP